MRAARHMQTYASHLTLFVAFVQLRYTPVKGAAPYAWAISRVYTLELESRGCLQPDLF
jgi:hypothetical protein